MEKRAKIIAVVGAGGKTTRIHHLAKRYREEGKTVFVTTTTHMWMEKDTVISGDLHDILKQIRKTGYCMAGMPSSDGKIQSLPETLFLAIEKEVDLILVEADGSKGMPIKMPCESEPVIPPDCDEIHIVMGMHALGKTFAQATHRLSIVKDCLGVLEDDIIQPWHIYRMIQSGYVIPLRKKYPHACIKICPAQRDTAYEENIAKGLEKSVPPIDLILLAAGSSSRFGRENKLLQEVNGKQMFTYTVDLAESICQKNPGLVDRMIIVSGYQEVISYTKTNHNVQIVWNEHPELGISESIKLAVKKAEKNHALLFLVCDQPNLKEETVEGLIWEYIRQSAKAGCVRRLDGTLGNPCIFHPDLRENLLQLTCDMGGKKVLVKIPEEQKCYYDVKLEVELEDIDTKEELEANKKGS